MRNDVSVAAGAAIAKWGESARAGFQILPDVLFKNQDGLGLSAVDLVVLTNLTLHWWYSDRKPFPRSTTIARCRFDSRAKDDHSASCRSASAWASLPGRSGTSS